MSAAPNLYHEENGWILNRGGACPVHEDATVRFQFACCKLSAERRAGDFVWLLRGWDFDIRACPVVSIEGIK